MRVVEKTTPPIIDSRKKKKHKTFFWREFQPFAAISRHKNNLVCGMRKHKPKLYNIYTLICV